MKAISLFVLVIFTHSSSNLGAYELGTHARMTDSGLSVSSATKSLFDAGLPGGVETKLGEYYFDMVTASDYPSIARKAHPFDWEAHVMPGVEELRPSVSDFALPTYAKGWLMRGTIREDDGRTGFGSNPDDDPMGQYNRFCNHFYDPVHNTKLTTVTCGNDGVTSAPLWALGVKGLAAPAGGFNKPVPLSPADQSRRNHYTLQDAREAMWRALTLRAYKDAAGTLQIDQAGDFRRLPAPIHSTIGPYPFSANQVRAERQFRDAYWATTFFSLGTMLHLNQDMAQPQHSRIEIHPFLKRKEFESYIEARALAEFKRTYKSTYQNMGQEIQLASLSYLPANGIPLASPAFSNLSDFWSTATTDIANGLGLADFGNSKFFSAAHNLGTPTYSLPSNEPSAYVRAVDVDARGYHHVYLTGQVVDPLYQTTSTIRMTRPSLLAEIFRDLGLPPYGQPIDNGSEPGWYTLDSSIFDDQAKLLIPRAVSYSAGIINYFFRGSMQITAPDEGVYGLVDHAIESDKDSGGFRTIKLKLANATPNETPGNGVLVAVVKYHRNGCYNADLSGAQPVDFVEAYYTCRSTDEEIAVSRPMVVAGLATTPTQYSFEFPQKLPINATDVYLQVVFRGQLGNEPDAVIVATKDLYEPTFFSYQNDADYISVGDDVYTRQQIDAAGVPLLMKIRPESCVEFLQTPRLNSDCFVENTMSLILEIGSRPATIKMFGLAPRQFARFAFLSDSSVTTIRRKAGTCVGTDYRVDSAKWQADYVNYLAGDINVAFTQYFSIRGIPGFYQATCLWNGDGVGTSTERWRSQMAGIGGTRPTPLTMLDF